MNRIIIAITALVLSVSAAGIGLFSLDSSCKKLGEELDEITAAAKNNDTENAYILTEQIIELWEKEDKKISLLVDHREIDEIERTIKSLPTLARQGSMERLEEQSSVAAERVRHIRKKEKISAENVF